jgi:small acid-soluble spore protein P (minor)
MSKPRAYSNGTGEHGASQARDENPDTPGEPLSGSKKVKNRNHSRNNHGEGH